MLQNMGIVTFGGCCWQIRFIGPSVCDPGCWSVGLVQLSGFLARACVRKTNFSSSGGPGVVVPVCRFPPFLVLAAVLGPENKKRPTGLLLGLVLCFDFPVPELGLYLAQVPDQYISGHSSY
jgi:hypothetical protein